MKKIISNNRGIVLVFTIVFVVIVSILVVGFMSRNSSQTVTTFEQSKRFQAEALLESAMWNAYMSFESTGAKPSNYEITVNGVKYKIGFSNGAVTDGVRPFNVTISY